MISVKSYVVPLPIIMTKDEFVHEFKDQDVLDMELFVADKLNVARIKISNVKQILHPEAIVKCFRLQRLEIINCGITKLPVGVNQMRTLQLINVEMNNLTYEAIQPILAMNSLRWLFIQDNPLCNEENIMEKLAKDVKSDLWWIMVLPGAINQIEQFNDVKQHLTGKAVKQMSLQEILMERMGQEAYVQAVLSKGQDKQQKQEESEEQAINQQKQEPQNAPNDEILDIKEQLNDLKQIVQQQSKQIEDLNEIQKQTLAELKKTTTFKWSIFGVLVGVIILLAEWNHLRTGKK